MCAPFDCRGVVNARLLGKNQNYLAILHKMQNFTQTRHAYTLDEIWFLEHESVFTSGVRFNENEVLNPNISVVQTNRGGALTFHGKGQLIVYFLMDLKRLKIKPRDFMHTLEKMIILFLNNLNIQAYSKKDAPGIYVENQKIASLGLKIEKNYTYHGISLNGKMDLKNFDFILPCGLNQKMIDLNYLNLSYDYEKTSYAISKIIQKLFHVHLNWIENEKITKTRMD